MQYMILQMLVPAPIAHVQIILTSLSLFLFLPMYVVTLSKFLTNGVKVSYFGRKRFLSLVILSFESLKDNIA